MDFEVRLTTIDLDGAENNQIVLATTEAEAELKANAFLGTQTPWGTIVSAQVWSAGIDARMLNEFEA